MKGAFTVAGLVTGALACAFNPLLGGVFLAFVVLAALTTTAAAEHVTTVKAAAEQPRAESAPGCAAGVLVLLGLFLALVLALTSIGGTLP